MVINPCTISGECSQQGRPTIPVTITAKLTNDPQLARPIGISLCLNISLLSRVCAFSVNQMRADTCAIALDPEMMKYSTRSGWPASTYCSGIIFGRGSKSYWSEVKNTTARIVCEIATCEPTSGKSQALARTTNMYAS
jgi:hypothetical protein